MAINTTQKLDIRGMGERDLSKVLDVENLQMVKENAQFQMWRKYHPSAWNYSYYLICKATQQAWESNEERAEVLFRFSNDEIVKTVRFASSDDYGCREKWERKTIRVWKMYANDDKVGYYRFGRSPEIFEIESGVRG